MDSDLSWKSKDRSFEVLTNRSHPDSKKSLPFKSASKNENLFCDDGALSCLLTLVSKEKKKSGREKLKVITHLVKPINPSSAKPLADFRKKKKKSFFLGNLIATIGVTLPVEQPPQL